MFLLLKVETCWPERQEGHLFIPMTRGKKASTRVIASGLGNNILFDTENTFY